MKVGFIGLGIMGKPMSKNLLKTGYDLVIYSRKKNTIDKLVSNGAISVNSPQAVAEESDVIITMLTPQK